MQTYNPDRIRISLKQCLDYEIHSSWIARYVFFKWGQEIIGSYYANKVRRKYRRYTHSMDLNDKVSRMKELYKL